MLRNVKARSAIMGRFDCGSDLLEELTAICRKKKIRLGRVEAIGTVRKARIGFFDQKQRKYRYLMFNKPMEIVSLSGNVSLKDGEQMVHAHIVLGDEKGKAYGGHLACGTVVFVCEFVLQAFRGAVLKRTTDRKTGLSLW